MQAEELYHLTTWIQEEIVDKKISQRYQELHKILQQNSQQNQQQPFGEQKESLVTDLKTVPLTELSIGQIEVLSVIGIADNVGSDGVESLEDTLFRNAIDIATAAETVQKSIQQINEGIQWSNQLRGLLSKIVATDEIDEIGDSVLLRVHFSGDAHLSNLTEFKEWGKAWWDIGRGIAMAHNEAPEDIRVVGASKGSIIISLLTAYGIAKTTSGIIMESLKVAEKVLDIRKKAEEVKALQLANDKAEKALNEVAENEKNEGIEKIIEDTIKKLQINRNGEGDKAQALDSSVRKLVDFVERGGEVDFVLPEEEKTEQDGDDEQRQERNELRVIFKEVRRLEKKVHQLEHKDP